jgi:hypothetical protein
VESTFLIAKDFTLVGMPCSIPTLIVILELASPLTTALIVFVVAIAPAGRISPIAPIAIAITAARLTSSP